MIAPGNRLCETLLPVHDEVSALKLREVGGGHPADEVLQLAHVQRARHVALRGAPGATGIKMSIKMCYNIFIYLYPIIKIF